MSDRPEFGCRFVKMSDGTLLDPAAVEAIRPAYDDDGLSYVYLSGGGNFGIREEPDVIAHAVTVGTEGFSMKPELQGPVGFVQPDPWPRRIGA